jgi:hypothetical protein
LAAAAVLSVLVVSAWAAPPASAGSSGSGVLPPSATPLGYSRADMTRLLAQFTASGNDPKFFPTTPFQILYTNPSQTQASLVTRDFKTPCDPKKQTCGLFVTEAPGYKVSNSFTVHAGKLFFVPVDNADDSPPVVGTFPKNNAQAKQYIFDPKQAGGRGFSVTIDGNCTRLGPAYVAGPVKTPPLPDGGGTHMITIGAFLDHMAPGHHTVRIQGGYFGKEIAETYVPLFGVSFIALDFTYAVNVTK